jgi:hypothetical protein
MWFVFVAVGLALLVVSGLYVRRRIGAALALLGASARWVRVVRWAMVWLMFGYPLVMIVAIAISLALRSDTLVRFDGPVAAWLLGVPFIWTVLVVFQSVPWLVVIDVAYAIVRRRRDVARQRAIAVLAVVGVFAIYTPVRIAVERGDLRVRHHEVGTATGRPPFRIAFVADVQQDEHTDGDDARAVYALVNAKQPDVVLSGGDWINTGNEHIVAAAEAAGTLKSRLGTYSVCGDHEHFAYVERARSVREIEQAMQAHGVAMLDNEVRWFKHHGKRIAVAFLNYNYIHRTKRPLIESLLASIAHADYKIAVTHQLDRKLFDVLENKVDLVLGAHTHGGQVNPVVGVMHVELARLETDFIDGRYQRGNTTIIITAGVGYSIVPVRYASPGSIEIIELSL